MALIQQMVGVSSRTHLELAHDRGDLRLETLIGHLAASEVDLVTDENDGDLSRGD
jgi:hypothetical protein